MQRIINESSIQIGQKTKQDFVRTGKEMADAHNNALHRIAVLEMALNIIYCDLKNNEGILYDVSKVLLQAEKELEEKK